MYPCRSREFNYIISSRKTINLKGRLKTEFESATEAALAASLECFRLAKMSDDVQAAAKAISQIRSIMDSHVEFAAT